MSEKRERTLTMTLPWRLIVSIVGSIGILWIFLLAVPTQSQPAPKKFEVSAAGAMAWRVDTQTGEVVSCTLTPGPGRKSRVTCYGKNGELP